MKDYERKLEKEWMKSKEKWYATAQIEKERKMENIKRKRKKKRAKAYKNNVKNNKKKLFLRICEMFGHVSITKVAHMHLYSKLS